MDFKIKLEHIALSLAITKFKNVFLQSSLYYLQNSDLLEKKLQFFGDLKLYKMQITIYSVIYIFRSMYTHEILRSKLTPIHLMY